MPAILIDTPPIVITSSRAPEVADETSASVTVIDSERIERLGTPLIAPLLRLAPSNSVSTSGPNGSLTEVRIRGAEANHTLLFVDGIRINDPAADDSPRLELLNADLITRIEMVRGPQSALWGSDAIGGVIAINGVDDVTGYSSSLEAGSFGFRRASASASLASDGKSLSGAVGWQQANGIDSFGSPGGDLDSYRNFSGRVRGSYRPSPALRLGATGLLLTGRSQFDGYDLVTFEHTDTLDHSRNRLGAGRLWIDLGDRSSSLAGRIGASIISSSNRNYLDREPVNRTRGNRRSVDFQGERSFATGGIRHRAIIAVDADREGFHARDAIYGGATDQDRTRSHRALTGEWRAGTRRWNVDVALRRDSYNRFKGATSARASALVRILPELALIGSYAEGIAPPTFFDLYGFFPGNFVGNPDLKPERSRGLEVGIRLDRGPIKASLAVYRQRLSDEIVNVFDPTTFLQSSDNRSDRSRRFGIEAESEWQASRGLRLSAVYAYLRATQPDGMEDRVVELRRPRHSGSVAADGESGRWSYGASIAYVGSHRDVRDSFPFDTVRLGSYWLADARLAYRLRPGVELFARGSNLFDQEYQDTAGYRTEGRGLFGGVRLLGGP